MEELHIAAKNNLVILLLDRSIDVNQLPKDLKGKVIIALYYSFDIQADKAIEIAAQLSALGAYSCMVVKGIMREKEMIEEAILILKSAAESQGFFCINNASMRWYGPRFQFVPLEVK